MPTAAKRQENMAKHRTNAEKEVRKQAEQAVIPCRETVDLKPPRLMAKNAAAKRYWKSILERMAGLEILDDLDSEALGLYCAMLARHESMQKMRSELAGSDLVGATAKQMVDFVAAVNALESKQQALERNLLTYAEKLGLTPSGRARLAAKRAEAEQENDPDADLFG